jgi:hypothetical protein
MMRFMANQALAIRFPASTKFVSLLPLGFVLIQSSFALPLAVNIHFAADGAQEGKQSPNQITIDFSSPEQASSPEKNKLLTVDDVIKLSKVGIGDDVIIAQIKRRPKPFDLSANDLLQLKAAHVSDHVITAMAESAAPAVSLTQDEPSPSPVASTAAAVQPGNSDSTSVSDLKSLVGRTVIVQRMPMFQPGTFNRIPESYAGQKATITAFKPLAMPKIALSASALSRLTPEQRASIEDAKNSGTLTVQFADGTKADTGTILPSMLSNYLEIVGSRPIQLPPPAYAVPVTTEAVRSAQAEKLSPAEVEAALRGWGADHSVFIEDAGLMAAQGAQVPAITLFMPEAIIAIRSQSARKQYLHYDPTDEDKRRAMTVVARGFAGKTIADGCTSITRIVLLSDAAGSVVEEAYFTEPLDETWRNNFGAADVCQELRAKFAMAAVQRVKAAAANGEFFVAVFSGSTKTKIYKVKAKHQSRLGLANIGVASSSSTY